MYKFLLIIYILDVDLSVMEKKYLFESKRLGFRNWSIDDLTEFAEMNSDPEVMEYFPKPLTTKESEDFIERLQKHYLERGHNYFAVEILETGEWIGFIGLAYQKYKTEFSPGTDIGWRLKRSAWGRGYATEGARRCLDFAFNDLNLERVFSTFTKRNLKSENVMIKLGMTRMGVFRHPNLSDYPEYEECTWYQIEKNNSIS